MGDTTTGNAGGQQGQDGAGANGQTGSAQGTDQTDTGQQNGQQGGQNGQGGTDTGKDTEPQDVDSLPEWAKKQIRDLRGEAAGNRTKATAAEQAKQETLDQIAKLLGLKEDEQPDPAKLAEELGKERSSARSAMVELALYRAAGKAGADAEALTDSRAFMSKVDKLDPTAEDFSEKLGEAIKKAVQDNPKLKAAGQAPAGQSGGDFSGGTGDKGEAKSVDDFRKARKSWRSGT